MFHDQDMPKFLWAEACSTTVYVQNMTPHKELGKITPKKVFAGKTPEVSHFRIFGSLAYCRIPEEKREKLDKTAQKGYLMGYSENVKAYRVYLLGSRKSKDKPLVKPLQPAKTSTRNSPEDKASEQLESQEEEELIDVPTPSGRTSRELRQILRDAEDFIGAPKNSKREQRQLDRYQALVAQVGEPFSFQEVIQHQVWVDAMVEEYSSIMVNDVWEVVPRPQDKSVVGSRWIYKVKYAANSSVEKYKARFVAKGYAHKEGIDYKETFAPVARYISIRTVISLAAQMEWEIHQMDVKTTFLNGVIEEEVYIE
eukprot:PITA_01913